MGKKDSGTPLTPAVFYILLALMGKERHGYDIMAQVREDSDGALLMGPGTLYGSLDRMMDAGLVSRSPQKSGDARRIYYRLTAKGQEVLKKETERMRAAAAAAAKRFKLA